jgi:hypothetical protein
MEVKKIKVKGDPYNAYVQIISTIFSLTPLEQKVTAELLRKYEELLLEASVNIANEILFSTRISKEIREKLDLKEATYNNIKSSLVKKNIIINNGLNSNIRLTELHFVYEI